MFKSIIYYICFHKKIKRQERYEVINRKTSKAFPIFLNLISLLLFISSYYFYYLSLEKCLEGEDVCCKKNKWIMLKIKQLIISIIINSFLLFLIIYGILSKLHLVHFVIVFIVFIFTAILPIFMTMELLI